jgi:hypothetical protein
MSHRQRVLQVRIDPAVYRSIDRLYNFQVLHRCTVMNEHVIIQPLWLSVVQRLLMGYLKSLADLRVISWRY